MVPVLKKRVMKYQETATTMSEASNKAQEFFAECFGYTNGVGEEKKETTKDGFIVEFYSKDDPGMDDTFSVLVLTN